MYRFRSLAVPASAMLIAMLLLLLTGHAAAGKPSQLVANFSYTTSYNTANFTDTSTDGHSATINSHSWSFGDGATSTATNPSHAYAAAGTYNVSLKVTDSNGASSTAAKAVTVSGAPNIVQVFDHIPQFGIYVSTPPNYTPPPGVLMWSNGTEYARMLSASEKTLIGDDVALQITYHAQCDNYDRFGSVFFISVPAGTTVTATTPRTTIVDFITPFSDAWQGTYANHQYPDLAIHAFATALANASNDVYLGISGGSNPYSGDPCENGSHPGLSTDYKAVGFLYSLALASTQTLTAGQDPDIIAFISRVGEKTSTIDTSTATTSALHGAGTLMISIAGYGSSSGGQEYTNTTITVKVNGQPFTSFSDAIDCKNYAIYSPDGNPGIFQNNTTSNPRSWCPGAIVPTRFFDMNPLPATAQVELVIGNPSPWTADSQYVTSVNILER